MTHALHDLGRRHTWATACLLDFCRGLDEHTLHATVPGTFGTVRETLQHLIDWDASFLQRLTGARPAPPWAGDIAVPLPGLPVHTRSVWGQPGGPFPRCPLPAALLVLTLFVAAAAGRAYWSRTPLPGGAIGTWLWRARCWSAMMSSTRSASSMEALRSNWAMASRSSCADGAEPPGPPGWLPPGWPAWP